MFFASIALIATGPLGGFWPACLAGFSALAQAFAACNWHFVIYTALACLILVRADHARQAHREVEAREHLCDALLHLLLGFIAGGH